MFGNATINEASLVSQAPHIHDGHRLIDDFLEMLDALAKFIALGSTTLWRADDLFEKHICPDVTLFQCAISLPQLKRSAFFRKLDQLTRLVDNERIDLAPRTCTALGSKAVRLSRAGFWYAHLQKSVVLSYESQDDCSACPLVATLSSHGEEAERAITVPNFKTRVAIEAALPKYVPYVKHTIPWRDAAHMTLSTAVAQDVLDRSIKITGDSRRYGKYEGRYYVFPNEGQNIFHGYPEDNLDLVPVEAKRLLSE